MASNQETNEMFKILIIEPFYGGSHKQLVDLLCEKFSNVVKYTLPAKKWHWRARTSALYFSQTIPYSDEYQVLFTSSVLNLAEFMALRPDMAKVKKVLYFHENQLVYPVRKQQERDFQYGYNQVLSCLVADTVLFNSTFNQESFLNNIASFLKLIPDHRPKGLADQIRPKCQVLYYSLVFPSLGSEDSQLVSGDAGQTQHMTGDAGGSVNTSEAVSKQDDGMEELISHINDSITENDIHGKGKSMITSLSHKQFSGGNGGSGEEIAEEKTDSNLCGTLNVEKNKLPQSICDSSRHGGEIDSDFEQCSGDMVRETCQPLHIVWAHRWEHDKDPDTFFHTLYRLHDDGMSFHLSVMGEAFTDVPEIFSEARSKLSDHIVNWGYQGNKKDYSSVLQSADVAVSTALHEFFGVAMLEAVYFDCYPLCPDRLVYPEIFPACCLYRTHTQLYKRLREICRRPHLARTQRPYIDINRFKWETLRQKYENVLCVK